MTTIPEALAIAVQHHQAGRLAVAEQLYRRILAVDPNHIDAIHLLGVMAHQMGKPELAVDLLSRAIRLHGTEPTFHCNLASVFQALGNAEQAIACCRRALELKPDFAEAHANLGIAFESQGRLEDAAACYRQSLKLKPGYVEAHYNLGNVLKAQGNLDDAAACYRRALELKPDYAEAHCNLGSTFEDQGHWDEAIACYLRALELKPEVAQAHNNLGNAFRAQGKLDEAVACYRRAVELEPAYAEAYSNLGVTLVDLERPDEGVDCCRRAAELKPDSAEVHNNLGNAFRAQGKLDEAAACYHRALELNPHYAEVYSNLASTLKEQGDPDEALACYRRALEINPNFARVHSNLVYALHFSPAHDAAAIDTEQRHWDRRHAEPLARSIPPHLNQRSNDRRLRIGYVSPDFREHVVGRFILPLLESHDRERFEVYCYASVRRPDALTDRCRAGADVWRNVFNISDDELARVIRQDQIDILVDLTMHTAGNRLLAFARKPAPVQVSYLAYAGATGLSSMDYRLTDPYLDPLGQDEHPGFEEPIRLPETYWCYQPPAEAPPVNPLPALKTGHVTFGCLNSFSKVTPPTLAAWTSLMAEVPEAQLLLHAHAGQHRQRARDLFARHGGRPERLIFTDRLPMAEYFRHYQRVDVALDPFPYGGGTTTCDALWMGVPVVSLAGPTAVGRGGLSILSNVGLADFVAHDCGQYVRIARQLTDDLTRLSLLRATLRDRMRSSPLMDAGRFARHVETAYRTMWQRWCAAQGD